MIQGSGLDARQPSDFSETKLLDSFRDSRIPPPQSQTQALVLGRRLLLTLQDTGNADLCRGKLLASKGLRSGLSITGTSTDEDTRYGGAPVARTERGRIKAASKGSSLVTAASLGSPLSLFCGSLCPEIVTPPSPHKPQNIFTPTRPALSTTQIPRISRPSGKPLRAAPGPPSVERPGIDAVVRRPRHCRKHLD